MSISNKLIETAWEKKIIRFACIGIINTLVDFTILNILVTLFSIEPLIANLISASTSISISYFLNHHIVFRSDKRHTIKSFFHFFVVTGLGILIIQSIVIFSVLHVLDGNTYFGYIYKSLRLTQISIKTVSLNIAKICAVLVAMIWNYTIYHLVIFKTEESKTTL